MKVVCAEMKLQVCVGGAEEILAEFLLCAPTSVLDYLLSRGLTRTN
jgi:hypothetical protein